MRMTIYEFLSFCEDIDGLDIGDDVYDFVTHIDCKLKKGQCKDNYDKCMRYLCTQMELGNYRPNWYSNCYISEYIKKNIVAFNRFMNEENDEKFQPQHYEEIDDETFYVVDKHGELIGKSNCLNGAQIVSCLGKKEINKLFKKGRKK